MFKNKKPKPDNERVDRLGRERQPRTAERGNAAVFSYHASRSARPGTTGRIDPAQTPAAAVRRNQRFPGLGRLPTIAAGIVLLVGVMCNLFLSGSPQLVMQPAGGSSPVVPLRMGGAYTIAATELLRATPLNKNKLTVNVAHVADGLRARFPELARVDVSVPFIGTRPVVHLTPATPQLLLNAQNELYVIDTTGRAIMKANEVPNIEKLDLPVVIDQSGLSVVSGKAALPARDVTFITEVISQLKNKGLTITNITLPVGTSQMDIRLSGVGYFVTFNLQDNGKVEAGAFLAVKAQLDREHTTPKEYIDVRVTDRAYYK